MTKKKDWSHPKGKRFEELSASSKVDGVVVNVGDYGVFADIGYLTAYKQAILRNMSFFVLPLFVQYLLLIAYILIYLLYKQLRLRAERDLGHPAALLAPLPPGRRARGPAGDPGGSEAAEGHRGP